MVKKKGTTSTEVTDAVGNNDGDIEGKPATSRNDDDDDDDDDEDEGEEEEQEGATALALIPSDGDAVLSTAEGNDVEAVAATVAEATTDDPDVVADDAHGDAVDEALGGDGAGAMTVVVVVAAEDGAAAVSEEAAGGDEGEPGDDEGTTNDAATLADAVQAAVEAAEGGTVEMVIVATTSASAVEGGGDDDDDDDDDGNGDGEAGNDEQGGQDAAAAAMDVAIEVAIEAAADAADEAESSDLAGTAVVVAVAAAASLSAAAEEGDEADDAAAGTSDGNTAEAAADAVEEKEEVVAEAAEEAATEIAGPVDDDVLLKMAVGGDGSVTEAVDDGADDADEKEEVVVAAVQADDEPPADVATDGAGGSNDDDDDGQQKDDEPPVVVVVIDTAADVAPPEEDVAAGEGDAGSANDEGGDDDEKQSAAAAAVVVVVQSNDVAADVAADGDEEEEAPGDGAGDADDEEKQQAEAAANRRLEEAEAAATRRLQEAEADEARRLEEAAADAAREREEAEAAAARQLDEASVDGDEAATAVVVVVVPAPDEADGEGGDAASTGPGHGADAADALDEDDGQAPAAVVVVVAEEEAAAAPDGGADAAEEDATDEKGEGDAAAAAATTTVDDADAADDIDADKENADGVGADAPAAAPDVVAAAATPTIDTDADASAKEDAVNGSVDLAVDATVEAAVASEVAAATVPETAAPPSEPDDEPPVEPAAPVVPVSAPVDPTPASPAPYGSLPSLSERAAYLAQVDPKDPAFLRRLVAIGVDVTKKRYHWVAAKSFVDPLPAGWEEFEQEEEEGGLVFYYHEATDTSVWELPHMAGYKALLADAIEEHRARGGADDDDSTSPAPLPAEAPAPAAAAVAATSLSETSEEHWGGILKSIADELMFYLRGSREATAEGNNAAAERDRATFKLRMQSLVDAVAKYAPALRDTTGAALSFERLKLYLPPCAVCVVEKEAREKREADASRLAVQKEMINQLNEELRLSEARAHAAEERHRALEAQQARLLQDMAAVEASAKAKLKKKRARCTELAQQNAELETLSKEICEELQNMTRLNVSLEATCTQLRADLRAQVMGGGAGTGVAGGSAGGGGKAVLERFNIALADEKSRYDALQTTCARLEKESAMWQQESTLLHRNCEALEAKHQAALERIEGKDADIASLEETIADLRREKRGLVTKLQSLSGEFLFLNDHALSLQDNVKVFCRVVGPLDEASDPQSEAAAAATVRLGPDTNTLEYQAQVYNFDGVYAEPPVGHGDGDGEDGPTLACRAMYADMEPMVRAVLVGSTAGIFTYGRGTAAKAETLLGGIAPLALECIFHFVSTREQLEEVLATTAEGSDTPATQDDNDVDDDGDGDGAAGGDGAGDDGGSSWRGHRAVSRLRGYADVGFQTAVTLSIAEVYNDRVRDLLAPTADITAHLSSVLDGKSASATGSGAGTASAGSSPGKGGVPRASWATPARPRRSRASSPLSRRSSPGAGAGAGASGPAEPRSLLAHALSSVPVGSAGDVLRLVAQCKRGAGGSGADTGPRAGRRAVDPSDAAAADAAVAFDDRGFVVGQSAHECASATRSHLLVMLTVTSKNRRTGEETCGRLCLVDLAGSERAKTSAVASHQQLREAQHVSKALSVFGDVFAAVVADKAYVPYRNAKLTTLLQDILRADSRLLLVAHVAAGADDDAATSAVASAGANDDAATLAFAARCRGK